MNSESMKRKSSPSLKNLVFALLITSLALIPCAAQQDWPKIAVSSDGVPISFQVRNSIPGACDIVSLTSEAIDE